MIAMLRLQFIIFSLIGIGFVTRKKGIVSREGQRSITDLVINVVLPCNIVTGLAPNLAVLLAAMPAPATTSMLSSKYNCAPDFATKMVILSTLCSIPTIFLWGLALRLAGE